MARAIKPNETALIAHVTEPAVEVIDTEMERLGGEVVRRPVADVEAEIVAAEDAAMVAEEEAEGSSGKSEVPSARRRSNRRSTTLRPSLGAVRDRS